ncbi:MAG: SAM-dependent methyltransferase [Candidatus Omnitrophica bacterium 4484_70.1]|nr:MAG: SAM-dependent methyltransferase [Candidatus Omnitrophica bacterium 4484_70.1]
MKSIFNQYYERYDAWYERNKFAYLSEIEAIKKVLPKEGKGLEIGVGTGRFAHPLGIEYGIDPSINMLKIARKRGIKVVVSYGEHLALRSSYFDYIAIIITLCFVQNPQKVLEESKRILKKEGKIIIGMVDRDSFLGKFYQRKKSLFYKEANFLDVKEVTNLIKKTGFNKLSYYQTIFNLPQEINSIEKPQKGIGEGSFIVISAQKR